MTKEVLNNLSFRAEREIFCSLLLGTQSIRRFLPLVEMTRVIIIQNIPKQVFRILQQIARHTRESGYPVKTKSRPKGGTLFYWMLSFDSQTVHPLAYYMAGQALYRYSGSSPE